jgi:hypothetical protein
MEITSNPTGISNFTNKGTSQQHLTEKDLKSTKDLVGRSS